MWLTSIFVRCSAALAIASLGLTSCLLFLVLLRSADDAEDEVDLGQKRAEEHEESASAKRAEEHLAARRSGRRRVDVLAEARAHVREQGADAVALLQFRQALHPLHRERLQRCRSRVEVDQVHRLREQREHAQTDPLEARARGAVVMDRRPPRPDHADRDEGEEGAADRLVAGEIEIRRERHRAAEQHQHAAHQELVGRLVRAPRIERRRRQASARPRRHRLHLRSDGGLDCLRCNASGRIEGFEFLQGEFVAGVGHERKGVLGFERAVEFRSVRVAVHAHLRAARRPRVQADLP